MTDRVSVIIPDGEFLFTLSVVRCLGRERHRTLVCASDRFAPARFSRFSQQFVFLNPALSEAALLEALFDVVAKTHADVLLPVGRMLPFIIGHEPALRSAIAVAPIPSTAAFEVVRDKWRLAAFCQRHGLAHPQTIHFDGDPSFRERLAALPFPALLKPARASYGRGIKYFESPGDLLRAVESSPLDRECIVQSFVPGYDVDCNVLCIDGAVRACTIQRGIVRGHGRFKPPVGIDFVENDVVRAEAQRALAALGWTGIAHIDMRFDPDEGRAWILEINPRYWASLLGSLVAGVNFPHLACMAAAGATVEQEAFRGARYVAGRSALLAIGAGLMHDARIGARFRETSLSFVAADPAPEIVMALTRPFIGARRDRPKRKPA